MGHVNLRNGRTQKCLEYREKERGALCRGQSMWPSPNSKGEQSREDRGIWEKEGGAGIDCL